jgi:hypothetical protein
MPKWRDYFEDDELAAVMTYIRNSWGNQAPPVSKDTVAKVRAELAGQPNPWTAGSLAEFSAVASAKAKAKGETR